MNFNSGPDRQRRRNQDDDGVGATENRDNRPTTRKKKRQPAEMGDALRSVYQRAINEDIPPEMLDLLGKLA